MGSSSRSRAKLFDPIRKQLVIATDEEMIRQKVLSWMLDPLKGGYPPATICVEKGLSQLSVSKDRSKNRCDIAVFTACAPESGRSLRCALLIECKAQIASPAAQSEALTQVLYYSRHLDPVLIAIASRERIFYTHVKQHLAMIDGLPSYQELSKLLCSYS